MHISSAKQLVNHKISTKLTKSYTKMLGHAFKLAFKLERERLFHKEIYDQTTDVSTVDFQLTPLEKVKGNNQPYHSGMVCYKCGLKGHYAS